MNYHTCTSTTHYYIYRDYSTLYPLRFSILSLTLFICPRNYLDLLNFSLTIQYTRILRFYLLTRNIRVPYCRSIYEERCTVSVNTLINDHAFIQSKEFLLNLATHSLILYFTEQTDDTVNVCLKAPVVSSRITCTV